MNIHPITHPTPTESAPFYHRYISQVPSDDLLDVLAAQLDELSDYQDTLTEKSSLHRYAPDKWSIREVFNHIADTERITTFRALWIARTLPGELLSFDQNITSASAAADAVPLAQHIEELQSVRLASIALFTNLPGEAWSRSGIASGNPITVRALAFITAGHFAHHLTILRERYT